VLVGPILIIVVCTVLAIIIGGLVVFGADRLIRSQDDEEEEPVTQKPVTPGFRATANAAGTPTAIRITPSPKRHCLLAYNHLPAGSPDAGGQCSCLRDDVPLWSVNLQAPLFMAVTDAGCAILFDRGDDASGPDSVVVTAVDVAGIERLKENLQYGFVEFGTSTDGQYVWGVSESSSKKTKTRDFQIWSLDLGARVLCSPDPRGHDKDVKGTVSSVDVDNDSVCVHFDGGRGVTLHFNVASAGIQRPVSGEQIHDIIPLK